VEFLIEISCGIKIRRQDGDLFSSYIYKSPGQNSILNTQTFVTAEGDWKQNTLIRSNHRVAFAQCMSDFFDKKSKTFSFY